MTPKDKDSLNNDKDVYHAKLAEILAESTDEGPFDANYDGTTSSMVQASSCVVASSTVGGDSPTLE